MEKKRGFRGLGWQDGQRGDDDRTKLALKVGAGAASGFRSLSLGHRTAPSLPLIPTLSAVSLGLTTCCLGCPQPAFPILEAEPVGLGPLHSRSRDPWKVWRPPAIFMRALLCRTVACTSLL